MSEMALLSRHGIRNSNNQRSDTENATSRVDGEETFLILFLSNRRDRETNPEL